MLAAALRRCFASLRVLLQEVGGCSPFLLVVLLSRWVTYFSKPELDAWELRKGLNTLVRYDLVPEPKIIDAALRACRRLDDFASAFRILEVVKGKAGPHKEIYPYMIQKRRPSLDELGISTPEEVGLDKAYTLMDGLPKGLLVMLLDYTLLAGDADDKILF